MTRQQKTALARSAKPLYITPTSGHTSVVDPREAGALRFIAKSALKQGTHIVGGPGCGKSRLLGRGFAYVALARQEADVVMDPTGAVIDNLFDKIAHLPIELQKKLWSRIFYVNAGDTEYVVPTPLYYRHSPSDTLFEVANRFPSVLKRQDEHLVTAPILGWNSLYECAMAAGQIAAALGRQIDFVSDLINNPGSYKQELRQALASHPELQRQVSFIRDLMDPSSAGLREKRTGSFKNKLLPFFADPAMIATFAASVRKLDFEKLIEAKKTVLIDLRNEWDPDRRQFKMIWYLLGFTNYIKHRGMAGRGHEVMFIIDEITAMLGQRTQGGTSILAEDLEELIAVLGRNYGVNAVLAHQNLSQVDERIRNVLMQMGNQIIGVTPNPDDALRITRQFVTYDPQLLRKREPVWMSVTEPPLVQYFAGHWGPVPTIVDYRTVEYTADEQLLMFADKLRNLARFCFYAKIASAEGDTRGSIHRISIGGLDRNQYPNEQILAPLRAQLTRRDGVAVQKILAHMQQTRSKPQKLPTEAAKSARLDVSSSPTYVPADNPPEQPAAPVSHPIIHTTTGGVDEDPWQE